MISQSEKYASFVEQVSVLNLLLIYLEQIAVLEIVYQALPIKTVGVCVKGVVDPIVKELALLSTQAGRRHKG